MTHSMVIPRRNVPFYTEAYRAESIKEINESAGLKHLIRHEMDRAYRLAFERYKERLEVVIVEIRGEFILELREVR